MDERQAQIKERAGLDESRLNQDLLDFLKKWGAYLMTGVAAVALAYVGWQYMERKSEENRDEAFVALEAAVESGNPNNLINIANQYSGVGAVATLARSAAADLRLAAYRTGIPVDVTLDSAGKLPDGKAFLTEEERAKELKAAEELYQTVLNDSTKSADRVFAAVGALNGLASVAEARGELDKAKGFYQQIQSMTKDRYPGLADAATKRVESLDSLATLPRLYNNSELPNPQPDNPIVVPAGPMTGETTSRQRIQVNPDGSISTPSLMGPDGKPIQLTPMPGPPPGFQGSGSPTPEAPATTPATPPATPLAPAPAAEPAKP